MLNETFSVIFKHRVVVLFCLTCNPWQLLHYHQNRSCRDPWVWLLVAGVGEDSAVIEVWAEVNQGQRQIRKKERTASR